MRKRTWLILIIAAGMAGAAVFGFTAIRRGFSARDNPSVLETYVATTARRLSVPSSLEKTEPLKSKFCGYRPGDQLLGFLNNL